jgi:beta-xylosidase
VYARRSALKALFALVLLVGAGCGQQNQVAQQATAAPQPTQQPVAVPLPPSAAPAPPTAASTPRPTALVVPEGSFQNPVLKYNFPDPFVLLDDGVYYAYATNGTGRNVQLARSQDLVGWELLTDAMPALASWVRLGRPDVWAPEVIKIGDTYVLYYTARDKQSGKQCVGVATSDKPVGKFRDTRDQALICQTDEGGTIDASPFRDDDGKLYLYFKNDGNCCGSPTYLYVQELAPDGLSLVGERARLVRNDAVWEGSVVEAPTMWEHDGKYYLFFSGNSFAGLEYAVGYATCASATGPCEDASENPILKTSLERPPVIGPGHQAIVVDSAGQTWLVYHAWEVASTGVKTDRRLVWIDRLDWNDGKPMVEGPTTGPQPKPDAS